MQIISELSKLPVRELFALTVLGALITTLGSLVATVLKEYFFTRSFETWKMRRELRAVYRKYRDPLVLSTIELINRLAEIFYESSVDFLDPKLLSINPAKMADNTASDLYFQRYKLVSSVYRLCAWLGWLELYRRDVTFLDSGHNRTNARFEEIVLLLRSILADGHLNTADDWELWKDSLIFREEQRAIGEAMLDSGHDRVVGYGTFYETFHSEPSTRVNHWVMVAAEFLLDLRSTASSAKDFRRARCLALIEQGISLIECLDSDRVNSKLSQLRSRVRQDISGFPLKELRLGSRASAAGRS